MGQVVLEFQPADDPPDEDDRAPESQGAYQAEGEDLPYKVEVWDADARFVEQVVAISISPAIGYAAYYAATREYPGRAITLRHRGRVISRWTGHAH